MPPPDLYNGPSSGTVAGGVRTPGITGTLETVTLFDLIITLAHGNKSSRLYLLVDDDEAELLFDAGELVSASFRTFLGEDAVERIFAVTDGRDEIEFYVEPLDPHTTASDFRTVTTPIESLLFDVAQNLDKLRGDQARREAAKTSVAKAVKNRDKAEGKGFWRKLLRRSLGRSRQSKATSDARSQS